MIYDVGGGTWEVFDSKTSKVDQDPLQLTLYTLAVEDSSGEQVRAPWLRLRGEREAAASTDFDRLIAHATRASRA